MMEDKPLAERIIVALVATVLKLQSDLHPTDKNRLDKWNKIEPHFFSETENIAFYAGKGLDIFDSVLLNAVLDSPRKLRTEQLYRTDRDGAEEEAKFLDKATKKAGGKS